MSIVLIGSTSGSITLQEPAVAGTTVLDLPATSGTILTTASQSIPSAALPAGTVLQVVHGTYATQTSNNTSTYADTGLTTTITPQFSTSKILILINFGQANKTSANSQNNLNINLVRNGSQIVVLTKESLYTNSTLRLDSALSFQYYDSPSSTSALTYKCQFKNNDHNGDGVSVQVSNIASYMTLLEIAA